MSKNNHFVEMFNTTVDIKLRQWADQTLPQKSVEAGWEALRYEFTQFVESRKRSRDHDDIFDRLKQAVIDEAMARHKWEPKVCFLLAFNIKNI